LVQAFRAGQVSLKTAVPPGLAQLADPYDPMANSPYRWDNGHPLQDMSYYKGRLFLYFGVTPALVLFWPCAALTGHYLLHKDAVVIFFSAGFLAGAGLLLSLWRRYFADVSLGIIVSCVMALGLANLTPVILERCDVYEVAISCGYAMTMLALAGIWCSWHDSRHQWQWLAAASLAYGLAIGARPSLLLGAVILLVPVFQPWRQKRPVWPLLMAAIVPIVLIGLGLMCYNSLRFDSPFEFGLRYQLATVPQLTMEQFSPRYLWFNLRVGFLEPACWSRHFPYVNQIVVPPMPVGAAMEPEHPFGVLTNIPLVWLAFVAPLAWRSRSAGARSILRCFLGVTALLFVICTLTIGLYFNMCPRYEVEYAHALVLLAVVGVIALEHALAGQLAWRRAARCVWGLLLTFSVAFNMFASFDFKAKAHFNLGHNLLQKHRVDEAITHCQKALQIEPDNSECHNDLGLALLQKERVDEAISHFQRALQIHPGNASAHLNLGSALRRMGRMDEAISEYQKALQIDPLEVEAQNNLAWLLATCPQASLRNGDKAVELARQANGLTDGENPVILRTLAAALAEDGRFPEAAETAQRALHLAVAQSNTRLAGQLQSELKLYQAGSPFHVTAQTH
jgi:Flp pilus assembly protein TadD